MADKKSMEEVEKSRQDMIKNWGPRHFTNMLDQIVENQKRFASKFCDFDNLTLEEKQKWTKEYVVCMLDELSEVLGWINWKHWKKEKPVNELEIKYELIDLLHFLIDTMLVWNMTAEDIFSMYRAKNWENHRRQNEGY